MRKFFSVSNSLTKFLKSSLSSEGSIKDRTPQQAGAESESIDTSTALGRMTFSVIAAVAELERRPHVVAYQHSADGPIGTIYNYLALHVLL